ncbi:MAG: hypothetical protein ACLRIS_22525 [Flavonifractor plautii]
MEKAYEISTEASKANSAFTYMTSPNVPAGTEGSTTEAGPTSAGCPAGPIRSRRPGCTSTVRRRLHLGGRRGPI